MTISINYVGDQAHFVNTGANARGYWANQLNPVYLAGLGGVTDVTGTKPILIAPATSANVAKAQAAMAGIAIPASFQNAANANPNSASLTIANGLVAFPQYGNPATSSSTGNGVADLWGANSANLTYHSFQFMVLQRTSHGLSFNINYTYSKNIGDDSTFRSGFPIPASAISGGGQSWSQDRIERSWTTISAPQVVHAFGVYQLPFGKGKLGGNSMLGRTLAGGWTVSGIYTYGSGTPIPVISSLCNSTNSPLQGQCMPDVVPYATNARINGSYGTSPGGTSACNHRNRTRLHAQSGTSTPHSSRTQTTSPRPAARYISSAMRLVPPRSPCAAPATRIWTPPLRKSFNLPKDIGTFVFEVDCINVWNKVTFSNPASTFGNSNFGQISSVSGTPGSRDFQFAGHINF